MRGCNFWSTDPSCAKDKAVPLAVFGRRWRTCCLCSSIVPAVVPLASFPSIIRDFEADAVGVCKERRVIVSGVLRVELRRRTDHSGLRKAPGDGIHGGGVLNPEAEVMK